MRNAKLKEVIEHHLRYEVGMLFKTYGLIAAEQFGPRRTAFVEAFCIHARALHEFLTGKPGDRCAREAGDRWLHAVCKWSHRAEDHSAAEQTRRARALIGYMRVSKADGSQVLHLQRDALLRAGVRERHLYSDTASGKKDDRPGLAACLQALRQGDTLVVWKLDRLGRSLRHLVNVVHDLTSRGVGLRVLTGQGAAIDTTTPAGKLVFGIFASLAEFERDLISERTRAGLASARARGRKGGRRPKMTPAKLRLAMAAMGKPETNVGDLCRELGITRSTLYRHVSPDGEPRINAAISTQKQVTCRGTGST